MSLENTELTLVQTIDDAYALRRWLGERRPDQVMGCDTESSGLDKYNDVLRLVQFGDDTHGWAIPWERWGGVVEDVVRLWEGEYVFHHAQFDLAFFDRYGVHFERRRVHDTMIQARINEPHLPAGLKPQATRHVDAAAAGLQADLANTAWTWANVPIDYGPYWMYGALDPVLTFELDRYHRPIIEAECPQAYELEMAVLWVCEKMERNGIHVDVAGARKHNETFMRYCSQVERWCVDTYGVKPGSNAAIIEILERDGFTFSKATKSGAKALDAEVLEGIDHPLAQAVLQRRQMLKMASTYLSTYAETADANGLLHPNFNTLGARTSRMSVSDPNIQNLPRRGTSKPGDAVRSMITSRYVDPELPDDEWDPLKHGTLIMCDFAQIETRLMAAFSRDPALIEAFHGDDDFFVTLARQIYQDDTIDKKDARRRIAKNSTYSKLYGAGIRKFSQTAGISEAQGRAFMQRFDSLYPGVNEFQQRMINAAAHNHAETGQAFVRSQFTNRRYVMDSNRLYVGVNYAIQGAAAEIMKMKTIELANAGLDAYLFGLVHDEVLLDVPAHDVLDVVATLQKVMNDDTLLSVPIRAEVSYGRNWGYKRDWTLS